MSDKKIIEEVAIKKTNLEAVKQYLLNSILPSCDVLGLNKLLDDYVLLKEIKEDEKNDEIVENKDIKKD